MKAAPTQITTAGRFVVGAEAPALSAAARIQVAHTQPSKKAAKLAATVAKAKVRLAVV